MNNLNLDIDLNEVFEEELLDDSLLENFDNTTFRDGTFIGEHQNKNYGYKTINNSDLNVSALCCDEEISGYDKLTGRTWIYPTNYPVRDYQFNIIKASILKNTLVSLPTGLGKTFIAAVIMYNFYRWYPLGKIVFTAPTRPLVAQQIEACYNIIAIPPKDTIEMTGHMQVNTRKTHWQTKRVFFATPQVIYNDIKSGICPGDKIRCLVIDEAHKARGNYAYCQIVSTLTELGNKTYRLLALSATPGSKVEDVVTVVKNLHIAHLELRTENCIDVAPYSHSRKISTVVVQLGPELTRLRQHYVEILDGYARRLKQLNILPQNIGNLSKGRIVMLYKEYQCKERGARHPQHNFIMKDFTMLIALYHGLELLMKHGSRVFLNFFDEHPEKSWIQTDDRLTVLLERLRDDLGINPLSLNRSILPDGTIPEIPRNLCFGHPKFDKLKEIMLEHFQKAKREGIDTRAIVFCEYRESVNLVHCLLLQCRPLIIPQMFVGQGASGKDGKAVVSQKQQMRVMRSFRAGESNALVATCVAEEGLDVGNVDLILCFDISTRSPIRLVQRCGRTGRERGGQVFILVTEGREHQTLLDCMRQRDGLNNKILQSREVENNLYKLNPRMVPRDFVPECQKMYISVAQKVHTKEISRESLGNTKKGQKDLRSMLIGGPGTSTPNAQMNKIKDHFITQEEFQDIFPSGYTSPDPVHKTIEFWSLNKVSFQAIVASKESNKVTPWLEWQRTLQKTVNIGHSRDSEVLAELLQYCDAKRFMLQPSTQNPAFLSQDLKTQNLVLSSSPMKCKNTKKKQTKSPRKKDGDIRALFSASTKSTKSYTKLINDLGLQDGGNLPTSLINLLVDLNLENANFTRKCYICLNICDCTVLQNIRKSKTKLTRTWNLENELNLPDIDLLDHVDAEDILKCSKSANETNIFDENINSSRDLISQENINYDLNDIDFSNHLHTPKKVDENTEDNKLPEENFNIGDIEDIFAESSPEILEVVKEKENKDTGKTSSNFKDTLNFFGVDSIEDIFAGYDDSSEDKSQSQVETIVNVNKNCLSPILQPLSPSILSGKLQTEVLPMSPIICSNIRKYQLSTKKTRSDDNCTASTVKKRLKMDPTASISLIEESACKANDRALTPSYIANNNNKSMFTVTQLVEMINKSDCDTSTAKSINVTKANESNEQANVNNRSSSPILQTQADKRKMLNMRQVNVNKITATNRSESLIILDSDSESDDNTQGYSIDENFSKDTTNKDKKGFEEIRPINCKRKLTAEEDEIITPSQYFKKRHKLNDDADKPLTLQEKVLAALTSNKSNYTRANNSNNIYCAISMSSPSSLSQKENMRTIADKKVSNDHEKGDCITNSIEVLQRFRRDVKISPKKPIAADNDKLQLSVKRKLAFSDSSDDDFIGDTSGKKNCTFLLDETNTSMINQKVRKKKKRRNEFLEEEAELSEDGGSDSGDELSDESIGSIIDFICDDNITHTEADMHAYYLKSVKSPVKVPGAFKIPQVPKMHKNVEVFSQFVEEDSYELDSFCVDSHIGLTQGNDESELEVAEKLLESELKKKKKISRHKTKEMENGDSPIVRRRNKNVRQIHSDSDESS